MIAMTFFFIGVTIVIHFFFLLNLRDLLQRVRLQNQAMVPGYVWLNLIPVFGYGWMIYTVIKVRDSVRSEFRSRGWWAEGDLGYRMGMAFAVLWIVGWALSWVPGRSVSVLAGVISVGGLVCWIIYWVKTSELKRRLTDPPPPFATAGRERFPGYPGPGGYGYPEPGVNRYPEQAGEGVGDEDDPGGEEGQEYDDRLEPAAYCPVCGFTTDAGDRFCRRCGSSLD